ncbi:hypothetical protein B5F40_13375 [Gordonibacter sp. An230]|uniref:Hpt domain-containing protein n=1 Tax=Gordonibacter sp. An230 TaxID=1965592 RepID=UPI000B391BEB|nr:Hpt domain-containing protein [Gordonibacter sp. An230]OUO87592.1 hypothetical protein B5F40_13375 [Gordonibacter sp. An230]
MDGKRGDASLEQRLRARGVDYQDALRRFDGNEALYRRLAVKFADDPHFPALERALSAGDAETALCEAHSLKGVAGSLSFRVLHEHACAITDALRAGDAAAARDRMPQARTAYDDALSAARELASD